jgi:DNA-directed RNA polymerase subunit RPC12/RpoP
MPTVADVVRRYGDAYLAKFGKAIPSEHRKVLAMIARCRTGELGTVVYRCLECGRTHRIGRSCGNRHCPTCQQHHAKAWCDEQTKRLLPCHYFLLTFTLPASLRRFVRSHQRACYDAMFAASSATLRTLAADPKYVGSPRCGLFGVLHTWGRTLDYHPHLHYVVPGGALSEDGRKWLSSRVDFFIPVKAASAIYRAKFRDEMRKAGLLDHIPLQVWGEAWVVHSQAVGDGRQAVRYLAPYVFRVAISDRRIVAIDDGPDGQGQVTFSYRRSGSRRWRNMTVSAAEFLRRFLQHVLPSGFQKVRHYGFAAASQRKAYETVRWLVTITLGLVYVLTPDPPAAETSPAGARCPDCGGRLVVTALLPPPPYLDSS